MFVLRALIGTVWNDTNAAELAQIQSGQLYLVRPDSLKGSRECIYNNAMMTLRRTSTDHNFQLVVTRVYEDDEQDILDEDEETDDEKVFLIDQEIQFRTGMFENDRTFAWRDLDGDPGDLYEFVAHDITASTSTFFETAVLKAIYERKYNATSNSASESDLHALAYTGRETVDEEDEEDEERFVAPVSSRSAADDLAHAVRNLSVSESAVPSTPKKSAKGKGKEKEVPRTPAPAPAPVPPTSPLRPAAKANEEYEELIASEPATLYIWNPEIEQFEQVLPLVQAMIARYDGSEFDHWLIATDNDLAVLSHRVSPTQYARWSKQWLSITWNDPRTETEVDTWCLRFDDVTKFQHFQQGYARVAYEVTNQESFSKAKAPEQDYVLRSYDEDVDVEMLDAQDEEDAVAESLTEDESSDEESDDEETIQKSQVPADGEANSQLTVGHNTDRTFVVRGKKIGVFKHNEEGKLEYAATINKITTNSGKAFAPEKVMLHNQDASMILMNPADRSALYRMDVERGQVVDEWKVHDDVPVTNIAPDSKFAQMTVQQTFVGASHNGLFRIDPRLSGKKLVDSEFKQYATKAAFSSVATTQLGGVAVASAKGDVRLFDKVGKNAKTALPALGDPILGIDVTADGKWIVATCKTYLLVFDTTIGAGKYSGELGFNRSFPADAKPQPKRLQLRPEHVAYMGGTVNFTAAKFNTGPDQVEKTIVTSSGKYVIAWDFKKVKQGRVNLYEIKKYEDTVVADNFRFGNDKDIVVALSNNVLVIDKKTLKKPTRQSFATSALTKQRPGLSSNNIVNSPY